MNCSSWFSWAQLIFAASIFLCSLSLLVLIVGVTIRFFREER